MTPEEFIDEIIDPTLTVLSQHGISYTQAAQDLLLGTAIQESRLQNIKQIGGPALGFFQMEPATHNDIWINFLSYKPDLAACVSSFIPSGEQPLSSDLITFPKYACAMARVLYFRCPKPIPTSLEDQAAYYKQYYNTPGGAATTEEYLNNWAAMHATNGGLNA
jgi:hypothetical protein